MRACVYFCQLCVTVPGALEHTHSSEILLQTLMTTFVAFTLHLNLFIGVFSLSFGNTHIVVIAARRQYELLEQRLTDREASGFHCSAPVTCPPRIVWQCMEAENGEDEGIGGRCRWHEGRREMKTRLVVTQLVEDAACGPVGYAARTVWCTFLYAA